MSKKVLETVLKVLLWGFLSIIVIIGVALSVVVWVLSPEKLTPIVEDAANEFLADAHCSIERVELTVWHTFPYATIEIDGVNITSSAFDSIPDEQRAILPADADTLLSFNRFRLGINLPAISTGRISLNDIMLDALKVNAVALNDSVANWNIVAPSEEDTTQEPLSIPDIVVNSVELTHCRGIRFVSIADSIEASVGITAAQIKMAENDKLQLLFDSSLSLALGNDKLLKSLPLNVNGFIGWKAAEPLHVSLDDWNVRIADNPLLLSTDCNLESPLMVNTLDLSLGAVKFASLVDYLPDSYGKIFKRLKTDFSARLDASLTKPFNIESDSLPSLDITLEVPKSYIIGPRGRKIDNIAMLAHAVIDGDNLDNSMIHLKNLSAVGSSIHIRLTGNASRLLCNPLIDGELICNANISDALSFFNFNLPYSVDGNVNADTQIDFALNDITSRRYHKIGMKGKLTLSDLRYSSPADTIDLYAHRARFNMGSKESIKGAGGRIHNNLLRAHFDIDSLDMNLYGSHLKVIKGVSNAALSGNPPRKGSKVIPMGGKISAEKVQFSSPDSSAVRLNNIECLAVSRATDYSPLPQLNLDIKAKRGIVVNRIARGSLRDADIRLEMSPRKPRTNRNINRRIDSLARLYPTLSRDSLLVLARRSNRARASLDKRETLDLSVDTATRGLLRRWSLEGSLVARRASLRTPYFPLRNRITNLDLFFSTDSVLLNSGKYSAGRSSFDMKGGIRNLRSTLMGNNRRPLLVNFTINSDTLDVNELIKAAYAGSNFALSDSTFAFSDENEDDIIEAADTSVTAFIIPRNIDMDVDVSAHTGFYSDLKLRNLGGCLQIHDGALRLDDIRTESDAGGMTMDAIYATTNRDSIHFAMDLAIDSVHISRFIDMVPAVDSLMPLLKSMSGIIKADIAASADLDSSMNLIMPSLTAAMKLHGDSLVLFDSETFAKVSKMLMFKNKKRNMIDNMSVQIVVKDNVMQLYPFMFTMDRYKLGVMGSNDFALNLDYHVSVLKSPIPFKFGLNIKGNADNMKFSLGRARFKEGEVGASLAVVEAQRVNLRREIDRAFRRGAAAALNSTLNVSTGTYSAGGENLSHADSLKLIQQGLIEDTYRPLSKEEIRAAERRTEAARKEAERRRKRIEQEAMRRAEENLKNGVGGY